MTTVRELLKQKAPGVFSIHPNATVIDAVAEMVDKNIGSLMVIEGEKLVGTITERDYVRRVARNGCISPVTRVRDIMECRIMIARPEQSLEDCMALMTEKRVRHLPVLAGEDVLGVVSIGDLIKSMLGDHKFIIDQLEHYIHG